MTDDDEQPPPVEAPVDVITEFGLRALKNDTNMSDDTRLSLEIMARCPNGLTHIELDNTINELVGVFGSAAAAIEAIKLGYIKISDTPNDGGVN